VAQDIEKYFLAVHSATEICSFKSRDITDGSGQQVVVKLPIHEVDVLVLQEDPCKAEPKVSGNCFAAFPRWSFIKETGKCEDFIYGGCGGTANRFETKADCEEACIPLCICGPVCLPIE
jgi:hypothetical protein